MQTRPGARLAAVRTLDDQLSIAIASRRFNTNLIAAFGGLAMLLAALGVAGVLRYAVAERTPEIGLRMALGADRLDILRTILLPTVALAAAGVAIGWGGSVALSRFMRGVLYGVAPTDLAMYAAVSSTLFAVAVIAAWLPARTAMWLEPMTALRRE